MGLIPNNTIDRLIRFCKKKMYSSQFTRTIMSSLNMFIAQKRIRGSTFVRDLNTMICTIKFETIYWPKYAKRAVHRWTSRENSLSAATVFYFWISI